MSKKHAYKKPSYVGHEKIWMANLLYNTKPQIRKSWIDSKSVCVYTWVL
jgi:hypothetical protein